MKQNAVLWAVIFVVFTVLLVIVGVLSHQAGKSQQKAADMLLLATAPRETTWTKYTVTLPAQPPKTGKGFPATATQRDSAAIDSAIAATRRAETAEARADSLEALVWQLAQPYYVDGETDIATIRMLAMPMTRKIEYDVKPKPFNVDVPLEKIYVPVPQDEKWWEHPALVAGGIVLGAGAMVLLGK